jgi:hypothetical protein
MRFVRVFAQQGLVSSWLEKKPPLSRLLKCFDIDRRRPDPQPVSVYKAGNELEELEAVAAVFQTSPTEPEKRFGLLLDEDDCRASGLTIDRGEQGRTGISKVDSRHVNLVGSQEQFATAIVHVLKAMWEGQQRLRSFPAQQIAGQLAVFSKLPRGQIHEDSRASSLSALNLAAWHTFIEASQTVEIRGALDDSVPRDVVAVRSHRIKSWLERIAAFWRGGK